MIKNIVFDIGGVLIRFMPGEAMRKIGIPEEKIAPLLKASVYCKWWQELDRNMHRILRFLCQMESGMLWKPLTIRQSG